MTGSAPRRRFDPHSSQTTHSAPIYASLVEIGGDRDFLAHLVPPQRQL